MHNLYKLVILITHLLILSGCSLVSIPQGKELDKNSYYTIQKNNSSVIVFVHGILGNSEDTWTNQDTNTSWQSLVVNDKRFQEFDIYNVNYPTSLLGNSLNINDLGTYLKNILETDGIFEYRNIHIISHSLGGLVTKDMIFKLDSNQLNHIKTIAFLGVPSKGSSLVKLATLLPEITLSKTLKDIAPIKENSYLDSLNDRWNLFAKKQNAIRLNSWYETIPIKGMFVVEKNEADAYYNSISPLIKDHITIAKPKNSEDENYKQVMSKLLEKQYSPSKIQKIFSLPTIDIKETNITNQKYLEVKKQIKLINYSNETIFLDYIDLSSGDCYEQNDESFMRIWFKETGEMTKSMKIDGKIIMYPYVKLKLEQNEHLYIDVSFSRKIEISDEQMNEIKKSSIPEFISQKFVQNNKLMNIVNDQLMPYVININSTTDYLDCINLGKN